MLETGKRQPEAIELYKKSGYKLTPNYGQYAGVENSLCFEKNYNKKLMKNSRQEYNTIDEYILTFPKAVQKLLEGKEQ
ncbi:MAG TPA: hypothetical protein VJ203_03440 [Bacteroidales bacterium]|nr:hypothetical protein [Bacteroidales bacterium]